ncbi:SMR family transporter [Knoellia sp. S7-12]|uniref:DMT family transporter n=1 Tax=Knoellia sp. S7-12 TaxID=3126698 RepID=UPI0033684903
MSKWSLLLAAILSEVTASLSLKGALVEPLLYIPVVVGFVAAFIFLSAVLRRNMPIGVAYGVWAASGVALTSVLSAVIYDEPFTRVMGVGIVLIIAGVLLVEIGSQAAQDKRGHLTPESNNGAI